MKDEHRQLTRRSSGPTSFEKTPPSDRGFAHIVVAPHPNPVPRTVIVHCPRSKCCWYCLHTCFYQEFDLNVGGLVGAVACIEGTGRLVTGDKRVCTLFSPEGIFTWVSLCLRVLFLLFWEWSTFFPADAMMWQVQFWRRVRVPYRLARSFCDAFRRLLPVTELLDSLGSEDVSMLCATPTRVAMVASRDPSVVLSRTRNVLVSCTCRSAAE